jgi:hypothetical protein
MPVLAFAYSILNKVVATSATISSVRGTSGWRCHHCVRRAPHVFKIALDDDVKNIPLK